MGIEERWKGVEEDERFSSLDDVGKTKVKDNFFNQYVTPRVAEDKLDVARERFDGIASPVVAYDYVKSMAGGAASMVQGLSWLANKGTGGAIDEKFNKVLGRSLTDMGGDAAKYWTDKFSASMKRSASKRFISDKEGEIFGDAMLDPHAWGNTFAQSIPMMVPGIAAAGLTAKASVARSLGGKVFATESAKKVAEKIAMKKAAGTAAVVGSTAEGTISAGMIGHKVESHILGMKPEDLVGSPFFDELIDSGMEVEAAQKELAHKASLSAALPAGVMVGLLGFHFNKMVGDAVVGGLSTNVAKEAGKGAALEGTTEIAQGLAEGMMEQSTLNSAANVDFKPRDIANDAVAGLGAGSSMGFAVGAGGSINSNIKQYKENKAGTAPDSEENGAPQPEPENDLDEQLETLRSAGADLQSQMMQTDDQNEIAALRSALEEVHTQASNLVEENYEAPPVDGVEVDQVLTEHEAQREEIPTLTEEVKPERIEPTDELNAALKEEFPEMRSFSGDQGESAFEYHPEDFDQDLELDDYGQELAVTINEARHAGVSETELENALAGEADDNLVHAINQLTHGRLNFETQSIGTSEPVADETAEVTQAESSSQPAKPASITSEEISEKANQAATSPTNDLAEPTQAQKESGNYKKGAPFKLHGLNVVIENPKDSTRSGEDEKGKAWSNTMGAHYGDIKGTKGADGDALDIFIGPNPEVDKFYVIDQINPNDGTFDEHKIMSGFKTAEEAKAAYLSSYDKDWQGIGDMQFATKQGLGAWIKKADTTKPYYSKSTLPLKSSAAEVVQKDTTEVAQKEPQDVAQNSTTLDLIDFSEKAYLVKGETKVHKEKLQALGGSFNRKHQGWMYSKKRSGEKLKAFVDDINRYPDIEKDVATWKSVNPSSVQPESSVEGFKQGHRDRKDGKPADRSKGHAYELGFSLASKNHAIDKNETKVDEVNHGQVQKESTTPQIKIIETNQEVLSAKEKDRDTSAPVQGSSGSNGQVEGKPNSRPNSQPKAGLENDEASPAQPRSLSKSSEQLSDKPKPSLKKKAKPKLHKTIDRLENYFKPDRIVKSYFGQDKVISFERGDDNKWTVVVAEADADGKVIGDSRSHSTAPSNKELLAWEKTNPIGAEDKATQSVAKNEGTAPEHLGNEGKPLDHKNKFSPAFEGEVIEHAVLDEGIELLEIDKKAFAEIINSRVDLFTSPKNLVLNAKRVNESEILQPPERPVGLEYGVWEIKARSEVVAELKADMRGEGYKSPASGERIIIELLNDEGKPVSKANGSTRNNTYRIRSNYNNRFTEAPRLLLEKPKARVKFREEIVKHKDSDTAYDKMRAAANAMWLELDRDIMVRDQWVSHAIAQSEDSATHRENSQRTILSLFDYTGMWGQPYADAGYNVIPLDIQNGHDILDLNHEYLSEVLGIEGEIYGILAACPCTDFSNAGARHYPPKDADGRTEASKELVIATLEAIEAIDPKFWVLENPIGRIEKLTGLPNARMNFDPWQFGHAYTKKTYLWGKFNTDLPLAPVDPVMGSKMHAKYGGKSIATKNARSKTPENFAYSFFMANNFADATPEKRLTDEYPEVSGAVKAALNGGISEDRIHELIEFDYGNQDYADARKVLADEILKTNPTESSKVQQSQITKDKAHVKDPNNDSRNDQRTESKQVPGTDEIGGSGRDVVGLSGTGKRSGKPSSNSSSARVDESNDAGKNTSDAASSESSNGDRAKPDTGRSDTPISENYRITSKDKLGEGKPLEKARANLDAIGIIKTLQKENRPASDAERAQLVKYTGWGAGALANNLFPTKGEPSGSWKGLYDEMRELLTPEELTTASRSTQYAHYTPKAVIDSIYKALGNMGFKRGMTLEGGLGTGHFIGLAPKKMHMEYVGVEMDGISAAIGKALYPNASVIHGDFTRIGLPENFFDLSIGNPPFASITVKSDPKYKALGFKLHDYFIAKQIDSVKAGGLAVFVTSKGTMDKVDSAARDYLADKANLLGAMRLPQTAFKASAGTEVVTDILFFQKKPERFNEKGEKEKVDGGHTWQGLRTISTPDGTAKINQYFASNPDMILGESRLTSSRFGGNEYTVAPTGNINTLLKEAVAKLPSNLVERNPTVKELDERARLYDFGPKRKEDSFYVGGKGDIRVIRDGFGQSVPVRGGEQRSGLTKKQAEIIRDYIPMRDAVMKVYAEQFSDGDWKGAQKALSKEYEAFVKKHGPINQSKTTIRKDGVEMIREPVLSALDLDPEAYRVAGIEHYDATTNTGEKADIFTKKIIDRNASTSIETAADAMNVTLNERGFLDIEYLIEKYNQPLEDVLTELGEAAYLNPETESYVTADDYLSGNVKQKLYLAKKAAKDDKTYGRNVEALESVQPDDMPVSRIPMNLGAHWIPATIVEEFAKETIGLTGTVTSFIKGDKSSWDVTGQTLMGKFGTGRMSPHKLLSAALNKKTVVIRDSDPSGEKGATVINKPETAAANQKIQELKAAFEKWALNNVEVSEQLHEIYNRDFNTMVPRQYNGDHLTLPRLSSKYVLHKWQKDVVWRILQTGNTYMAHDVGAGKTLASTVAGMELKRLGLAKKPTYVVLKSTLKQFATELLDAYPDANILVADERQLDKKNRRRFLAKIANNDYDAIIMTHESFETIPMSDEFVTDYINGQLKEYQETLESIDEADRASRKTVEGQIESLNNQLVALNNQGKKDKGITFQETGIDFVFVDEAHHHKKIPFPTNQSNTKGVDSSGSQRAQDLFMKSRYLNSIKPNKNLVLMSGTPVTNTLGEVFNIQRYLQPDALEAGKVSSFDAWSATFADTVTELEMQASGGFKPVTRLARFVGIPALLRDFLRIADIVSNKTLSESLTIKRPEIETGARQMLTTKRTPELAQFQKELGARIKALENKKGGAKKGEDNTLVIITDGRKAAYDMRMVGREQTGPSKIDLLIDEVAKEYHATSDDVYAIKGKPEVLKGSAQLIFTELAKASGFNIYEYIRTELVKKGVPEKEIAFIQEANNSNKKKKLFRDMNTGVKRIMIGGSKNMGTGVNVQQRLVALHHLDVDYLPAHIVQREGRAIRQGNKNADMGKAVKLVAYATEGTIDAFMWQLNQTKQTMIDQIMSGDLSIDTMEDVSDSVNQMAMAKALASGNPLLLEQAGLEAEVRKLEALKEAHINQRFHARGGIVNLKETVARLTAAQKPFKALAQQYQETKGDKFKATIDGASFKDRKKAGDELLDLAMIATTNKQAETTKVGNIGGYDVFMRAYYGDQVSIDVGHSSKAEGVLNDAYRFDTVILRMDDKPSAVGVIRQIENAAGLINRHPEKLSVHLDETNQKVKNLQSLLNSEFQYETDLQEKSERLEQVNNDIEAFDEEAVEETTPAGVVSEESEALGFNRRAPVFSRRSSAVSDGDTIAERVETPLDHDFVVSEVARLRKLLNLSAKVKFQTVFDPETLKYDIKEQAKLDGFDIHEAEGILFEDTVYVMSKQIMSVAQLHQVVLHEAAHYGGWAMYGKDMKTAYRDIWIKMDGVKGIKKRAAKLGFNMDQYFVSEDAKYSNGKVTAEERIRTLVDEFIAHANEAKASEHVGQKLKRWIKEFIGQFRQLMTKHFSKEFARFTYTDLAFLLKRINKASQVGAKAGSRPKFSRRRNAPDEKPASIRDKMNAAGGVVKHKADAIRNLKLDDLMAMSKDRRAVMLNLMTGLQIEEVYKSVFDQIKAGNPLTEYAKLLQSMDAVRNNIMHDAEMINQLWDKLSPKESEIMSDLMLDATFMGLNPDRNYTTRVNVVGINKRLDTIQKQLNHADFFKDSSEAAMLSLKGEQKRLMRELDNENQRRLAYPVLRNRYESMSDEAVEVYQAVKGFFDKQWEDQKRAVLDRIDRAFNDDPEASDVAKEEVEAIFMKRLKDGPYFPLSRFGDFVLIAKKGDEYIREHFENSTARDHQASKFEDLGYVVTKTKTKEFVPTDLGDVPAFGSEVFSLLDDHLVGERFQDLKDDLKDDINQLILKMMPDVSSLKHSIHRKKIKGFSQDSRRAFSHTAFHGAHHLTRIKHADLMQHEIDAMTDEVDTLEKLPEKSAIRKDQGDVARDVANHMRVRHHKIMNPDASPWTAYAGNLGFVMYLGFSLGAGLVNLTQTGLIVAPKIGAKYGLKAAFKELNKALLQYTRAPFKKGTYESWKSLSRSQEIKNDERAMLIQLIREGTIDTTQAHSLAQLSETDTRMSKEGNLSEKTTRFMRYSSALFHNAETLNREVAALAAYRIAVKNGVDKEAAKIYARKMINDGHFNYTSTNRSQFMKNDVVKVLTQFRQYSQHILFTLIRDTHQSLKGETKEIKREARKELSGILALHFVVAGFLGLPWLVQAPILLMGNLFRDDDDEPYEFEDDARSWLAENLGETAATALMKGTINALTPFDLHSRVKLDGLLVMSNDRDSEIRDTGDIIMRMVAGPMGGLLSNYARGVDNISQGNIERGIESLVPKAVRDVMRSGRYADEGLVDYNGNELIQEFTAPELVGQAAGIAPARVGDYYKEANAFKNAQKRIEKQRKTMLRNYAKAAEDGDDTSREQLLDEMIEFTQKYPTRAIFADSIVRSMMSRIKRRQKFENGIYLPDTYNFLRKRINFRGNANDES